MFKGTHTPASPQKKKHCSASNQQLKAEGECAGLKHWYPYSFIIHDKTLFSTLCFAFYVFAWSVFGALIEHKMEQSTSTFARSVSF
jgi:hypothetical protein